MTIATRATRSTLYVALYTYLSVVVTFISQIILARLLSPENFGTIALALFFLNLFGRVRELGLNQALVHKQHNVEEAYSVHFILHMLLAFLNLALVLIALPILYHQYPGQSQMIQVLVVLAVFVLFQAASQTQQIAFEKELLFRYTTIISIAALLISTTFSIGMAYKGYGVWSLVAGNTMSTFVTFIGLWIFRPWKLSFRFDTEIAKWFLKFGFYLALGAIVTFVLFQFNDFIIGTVLGTAILGYYSRAFKFAELPTSLITSVVSRVAMPTYSKLQHDHDKLQNSFNFVLRNIVRVTLPLTLILFFTAHELILTLIGDKWLPMVPIFQFLIVYSFLRSIFDDAGAFLTAIGKPQIVTFYIAIQAIFLVILTPLLVLRNGVDGAAISLDIVMVLGVLLAYYFVSRKVLLDFRSIMAVPIVASLLALVLYFVCTRCYNIADLSPLVALFTKMALIGGGYTIVTLGLEGRAVRDDLKLFFHSTRGSSIAESAL